MVDKNGNGLNKKGILLVIAIATLLVIGGISFAYTWADKLTNEPLDVLASTATLKLRYNDCANEDVSTCGDITADLAPGESISKTFEVKNVGTLDATYDIYFRELENTFKNSDLVYTLEDLTNDKFIVSERVIPMGTKNNILIKRDLLSPVGSTVRYKLTVTFLNREYDQSENMDAEFSLKLKIEGPELRPQSIMMSRIKDGEISEEGFWSQSENIERIIFEDTYNPKENATYTYDVSDSNSAPESVMAYLVPSESDSESYIAYIQGNGGVKAPVNSNNLFYFFSNLISIENIEIFDTSDVTNMGGMFQFCGSLTVLDLSSFDTSNVIIMSEMFLNCYGLTSLDVSNFDFSKLTNANMELLFANLPSLTTLKLDNVNTSSISVMRSLFDGCRNLKTLDLSSFDTSSVTDMSSMFAGTGLTTLDLSSFDTSNVDSMGDMFGSCINLKNLNLSSFDTSNVTNVAGMFNYCTSLTALDLSNFNTSKVKNINGMFMECTSLTDLNIRNWNIDSFNENESLYLFYSVPLTIKIYVSNSTVGEWVINSSKDLTTSNIVI